MIPLRLLSQVILQHLVTKIFGKPGRALLTTFKGSEVEVITKWSGNDLKLVIKKVRGQVSRDGVVAGEEKKIWTPRDREKRLMKPRKIISPTT